MTCCVPRCPNKLNKNISYHIFPHPQKDSSRHKQWVNLIDSPKFKSKDPMIIYKQYRVCRSHFEKKYFNGGCKRLLNTAIPTLYLNNKTLKNINNTNFIEEIDMPLNQEITLPNSYEPNEDALYYEIIDVVEDEMESEDDHDEMLPYNIQAIGQFVTQKEQKSNEELMETESFHEMANGRITPTTQPFKIETIEETSEYDIIHVVYPFMKSPLSEENLKKWRAEFKKDSKNLLAQNICSRHDPFDACLSRTVLEKTQHVFNYKIESEAKPLTNQKSSGRCWIFAALNVIRLPFMKELKLEEFEFSQGYLFYWDKIERCHYFLNSIVEVSERDEEVEGRLISFLLSDPTCDGGQWDMLCNLVNKHGLMPKKCFPETFSCESSLHMNQILKSKLREYAKILHDMVKANNETELIKKTIEKQMVEIYNVVGICLGIPPETFVWEYYSDKNKEYKRVGPISPIQFYETIVKKSFNVDDKICLVNDPRPTSPYSQMYTVDCLGNVVGGRPVRYNNQPIEILMNLVTTSLRVGEAVWFGCEVGKRFAGKLGMEDLEVHDFKLVFNVDIQITMSKADRLRYGESAMTHAMAFTAVSIDENDKPTKFRVENSWGEDRGEKGYLIMSADWFKEFVFEIVVDKSIVPKDIMDVFDLQPTVLPAWDPMGTLAKQF